MAVVADPSTESLDGMLGRIANWWRAQKEWRRVHIQAFAEADVADSEGITIFQRRLIDAVSDVIASSAFRRETSAGEVYLVAEIPGTDKELFVYSTEAQFASVSKSGDYSKRWPFEEWDYRTPDELIAAVVEDIKRAV